MAWLYFENVRNGENNAEKTDLQALWASFPSRTMLSAGRERRTK